MSAISPELLVHLYREIADYRSGSVWVMNVEWLNEVRSIDVGRGLIWEPSLPQDHLFGIPIEIRDIQGPDGVPHLEVRHV